MQYVGNKTCLKAEENVYTRRGFPSGFCYGFICLIQYKIQNQSSSSLWEGRIMWEMVKLYRTSLRDGL